MANVETSPLDNVRFTLLLPKHERKLLDQVSAEADLTTSQLVRKLIRDHLEKNTQKKMF